MGTSGADQEAERIASLRENFEPGRRVRTLVGVRSAWPNPLIVEEERVGSDGSKIKVMVHNTESGPVIEVGAEGVVDRWERDGTIHVHFGRQRDDGAKLCESMSADVLQPI